MRADGPVGGAHPGGVLFLVELSAGAAGDAEEMQAALQLAVLRLRATGAPIRWCGGWLVPGDRRCLCLVEAPDRSLVALARDTAALTAAVIHPVRALPARTRRSPSPRTRGRS